MLEKSFQFERTDHDHWYYIKLCRRGKLSGYIFCIVKAIEISPVSYGCHYNKLKFARGSGYYELQVARRLGC